MSVYCMFDVRVLLQGVEDAVALLAQAGSSASGAAAYSAANVEDAKALGQAARTACMDDEVLKYVSGAGAKRFNLLSLVPKSRSGHEKGCSA